MDIHANKTIYRSVDGTKSERSPESFLKKFNLDPSVYFPTVLKITRINMFGLQHLVRSLEKQDFWGQILSATETGVKVSFTEVECQDANCEVKCSWDGGTLLPLDESVNACLESNGWNNETVLCECCQDKEDRIEAEENLAEAQGEH